MFWPGNGRLSQSRNCAVESTWSSYLPLGKTVISCRYPSSHGAAAGIYTKPFSIIAVCACRRMILSHVGWYRLTPWQPSAISSWISWVPEALSSINTSFAPYRRCCSRTARLSAGYSSRRRNRPIKKKSFPLTPQVVHTEKSLSSVALLAVSQLCTMRSKRSGRSFSRYRLNHSALTRPPPSGAAIAERAADAVEGCERLAATTREALEGSAPPPSPASSADFIAERKRYIPAPGRPEN